MSDLIPALMLTLAVACGAIAVASLIGLPLGLLLRWTGRRTHVGLRVLLVVAAFTPHYVAAAGWEAVWGKFGLIPLTQVGSNWLPSAGLAAVIWIHGISGVPWVALAVDVLRGSADDSLIDAARTEAGIWGTLWHVQLPLARLAWIAAACVIGVRAVGEFTVADLYGVRTLADKFYLQYTYEPRFAAIALFSLVPLFSFVVVAAYFLRRNDRTSSVTLALASENVPHRWTGIVCSVVTLAILFPPLMATFIKAGWIVRFVDEVPVAGYSFVESIQTVARGYLDFRREIGWTLALTGLVVLLVVPLSWGLIVGAASRRRRHCYLFAAAVVAAIPAPLIGMFWIWFFDRRLPPGFGWLYDHTLVPTAFAVGSPLLFVGLLSLNLVHGMLPRAIRDAASVDGAGTVKRLWFIELPLTWYGIVYSALVVAAFAIMDLSVTILVRPPGVETISTRLFGLLHSGVRQQEAALTLSWLGVALGLAVVSIGIGKMRRRRC